MTVLQVRKKVVEIFKNRNIDLNQVNILFCECLNCSRAELLSIDTITTKQAKYVIKTAKKRAKGIPLQKIFGREYFFGLEFKVNKNVLCPRPETEILVEEALKFVGQGAKVLDLCTGSGAIAVALAKNSKAQVVASDISSKALQVAKHNAKTNNANVEFKKSNMFKKIKGKFDVVVSNPPYIKTGDIQNLDVEVKKYDPIISLDGGADGLDFYRQIANESKKVLNKKGVVLVEVGFDQAQSVKKLFEQNGFVCYTKNDYNNIQRIVVGELI